MFFPYFLAVWKENVLMLSSILQPHIYQDSHLLLSKYYCVVGHHQTCVQTINPVELLNIDTLSKRGKYILAEALTCKGITELWNYRFSAVWLVLWCLTLCNFTHPGVCIRCNNANTLFLTYKCVGDARLKYFHHYKIVFKVIIFKLHMLISILHYINRTIRLPDITKGAH